MLCDLCYTRIIAGDLFLETEHNVACEACSKANGFEPNRVMIDHTTIPPTYKTRES